MSENSLILSLRPKDFDEVLGLEGPISTVRDLCNRNVIPRGFLIIGPYGCGKTTLALIIAKYVQGALFDGEPQVQEINAANYRKIDDMRELARESLSIPMQGNYGVIIMDEAQQIMPDAQQILLKELERKSSPTVWILATTNPEKINRGVQDRCTILRVEGMTPENIKTLVTRGAAAREFSGDTSPFIAEVLKRKLVSPRRILGALEVWMSGTPLSEAVGGAMNAVTPADFDIAMGIIYGNWESSYNLFGKQKFPAVKDQLKALDDQLKKKPMSGEAMTEEEANSVDDEDLTASGKAEKANSIRLIVAALLKNVILKGGDKSLKAAQALAILGSCVPPTNAYGAEWPYTVAGLYRVYMTMRSN